MLLGILTGCGASIVGAQIDGWGGTIVDDVGSLPRIDARTAAEWQDGHIPNAAQLHWTELIGTDADGLWGVLPSTILQPLLSARGIPSADPVVVYGSGAEGYGDDGNVYWTLRYLGHSQVQVLNGGWAGWLASGNAISAQADAPVPVDFQVNIDARVLATTEQVSGFEGVLLDVRSEEEWQQGRIPGALWMEWSEVFEDGITLRPEAELRELFAELGIAADTPVIVYCAGGIRSGHTFMVLEALGHTAVRNYVGSWARWSAEEGEIEY